MITIDNDPGYDFMSKLTDSLYFLDIITLDQWNDIDIKRLKRKYG